MSVFRRVIEFVVDRRSAKEVEQAGQDALNKGTDPRKANQNLSAVERGMASLKRAALAVGGALAAAFALNKIRQFGAEAIRVAAESEAIWNRLSGTLRGVGVDFQTVEGDIRAAARAMQDITTVDGENFASVLQTLTDISRDYAGSMRNVQVVADLAAARQLDLSTSAQLVGRAMVGQTSTLTRYGIVVKEGEDAVEALRKQFDGMAENEAQTLAGRTKQLTNEWGDFKEAVGAAMLEAGGGTSVMETLIGLVKSMTEWVEKNSFAMRTWATRILSVGAAIGRLGQDLFSFMDPVTAGVSTRIGSIRAQKWAEDPASLAVLLGQTQAEITRLEEAQKQAVRSGTAAEIQRVTHNLEESRRVAQWLVAEIQRIAQVAGTAADATSKIKPPGGGGGTTKASPAMPGSPRAGVVGIGQIKGVRAQIDPMYDRLEERRKNAIAEWMNTHQEMIAGAQFAAWGVVDAWQSAFDTIIREGEGLGAFMGELGKGLGGALLSGLNEYAAQKVRTNVAEAIEQTARGFGALAMGDPRAGLHFKAAGEHVGAAAAWAALAGAAGSARSGIRGRSAQPGRASAVAGVGVAREMRAPGPEVHIYIDPLAPDDPRMVRVVRQANAIGDRYGVVPTIHRRTR